MITRARTARLRGRDTELRRLATVIEGGGALVVHGEAGLGKTALVERALADAVGPARVVRVRGARSEQAFAYAGLHQLLSTMPDHVERLPVVQRRAVRRTLGLSAGAPDPGQVTRGAAAVLAAAAPVVCFVDDVQWLDDASARVLAALAREPAPGVSVVFAGRRPSRELAWLPELRLAGLGDEAAGALLTAVLPDVRDEHVRRRVVAEARGNPEALLDLHRALSRAEISGGFGPAGVRPVVDPAEREFVAAARELPWATRRLLVLASAEPTGDPVLLRRAAAVLGLDPAAPTSLLTVGEQVLFRRPLARPALYHSAPLTERRQAHHALAVALADGDREQRAWHHAQAATAPDETVAAELTAVSGSARERGGAVAAAAFLTWAAELTPDPHRRAHRFLAAAQAKLDAGTPVSAADLVARARAVPLDEPDAARAALLSAKIAGVTDPGPEAVTALAAVARRLTGVDPVLARETYLEALTAAVFAGDGQARTIALAAKTAPPGRGSSADLLLDAVVVRFTDGYAAAAPLLREAAAHFRRAGADDLRWLWLCSHIARDLFDAEGILFWAVHQVEVVRAAGALPWLPRALAYRARVEAMLGRIEESVATLEEADSITTATGAPPRRYIEPFLAAWRGVEEPALDLVRAAAQRASASGQGLALRVVQYSAAILHNGLGQYRAALAAAQEAAQDDDNLGTVGTALVELVEAAVRCDEPEVAAEALSRLVERTDVAGTELAYGLAARSRALVSTGAAAEEHYRAALAHLTVGGDAFWLARTHLVHGEWLRRAHRRVDARAQLRLAADLCSRVGADAFAARAHRELLATAETVQPSDDPGPLSTNEAFIARLARDGHTNREIAAQLTVSPRTVEWHLSKVFTKLGIRSRRQLRAVLPQD
ncbi:LuxR family transcriptional regulator [Amycolatopsis rhabdoformis]|uniref:LuxR family transcriptional regulator n=1 Tax=Amycolatopsis rhabdoformis TaxID=1448059 RepID=A0ABZ1IBZ2_9PSEU|nr:LuxR family transcriptional regulator [Amycolatopsis rhabdoformis]WSE31932.1 LuxR family transcriptional regulator [Amycolatopsis rhabdoformis]